MPAANPIVDKCIECGFCEPVCPSKNLTLTPRQRITVWREINRLRSVARTSQDTIRLHQMEKYTYYTV
jgi:D-lactate dehydrogenase